MQEKQEENSCFHPTESEVSPVRLLLPKFKAGTGTAGVVRGKENSVTGREFRIPTFCLAKHRPVLLLSKCT